MGGIALHAGILAQWFEMLLLLPIRNYGRQWDFIWCNDTYNVNGMVLLYYILFYAEQCGLSQADSIYLMHNVEWILVSGPIGCFL